MAQSREEEKQLRDYQAAEMRKSWDESLRRKKEEEMARRAIKDIEFDKCGPSAAVNFTGQDITKEERTRMQKEQMKRWMQEQTCERAYQKKLDKEEDMAFAEMVRAVDSIRENNEREEAELAKFSKMSVLEQNAEVWNMHCCHLSHLIVNMRL